MARQMDSYKWCVRWMSKTCYATKQLQINNEKRKVQSIEKKILNTRTSIRNFVFLGVVYSSACIWRRVAVVRWTGSVKFFKDGVTWRNLHFVWSVFSTLPISLLYSSFSWMSFLSPGIKNSKLGDSSAVLISGLIIVPMWHLYE